MALQVWLPLTKDLRNQGLNTMTFTNTDTSNMVLDNAGKLGKCYKRTTKQTSGRIISNSTINLNGDISMCCWAKVTDGVGDTANGLVSNHSHADNTGFGICVKQISNTDYRICCSTGNGSGRTYYDYYGTSNIKDAWHHLTLTYNNTTHQFQLWVDGVVEKTQSYTNASKADYIALFEWSTTFDSTNYRPACSLNDVRIYDHCLSEMEVKELARGLVLHYPLNRGGFGQENLVVGSNTNSISTNKWRGNSATGGNTSTIEIDETGTSCVKVTRDNVAQSSWDYLCYDNFLRGSIKTNTTYTISFDCKPSVDGTISFVGFVNGNGLSYMTNSTTTIQGNCSANKWNHMVYRCTTINSFADISIAEQVVYFSRSASLKGTNVNVLLKNIKVEEGSIATPWCPNSFDTLATTMGLNSLIEYDCSGFCNNSVYNSKPIISSDTSKYNASTYFEEYNASKTDLIDTSLLPALTNCTITWWEKNDTTRTLLLTGQTTSQYIAASDNNTYYHSASGSRILYRDGVAGTYKCEPGVWHHYALVGVDISSWTALHLNSYSSYWYLKGYVSDLRIYATALSADDVKSLYQNEAYIDGNGNIYGKIRD